MVKAKKPTKQKKKKKFFFGLIHLTLSLENLNIHHAEFLKCDKANNKQK